MLLHLGSGASFPHAQTVGVIFPWLWAVLTDYVLGLCKVAHCGRVCYLLWSVSVFSSIHARSCLLLVLRPWIVAITHFELWLLLNPGLGCCWVVLATLGPRTTLSCLVSWAMFTLWLGLSTGHVCLLHKAVKRLFCCVYAVVGLWNVLAWPVCWWPDKPSGVGLLFVSLNYV